MHECMKTMRCLRPSGGGGARQQCPHLAAFCSSLVEGLAHLESTLDGGGEGGGGAAVSMRWCADAMRLVKRMQRELLAVFRSAGAPVTVDGACGRGGGDWLEQYMQETAALLDFCNAFKCAVARMHRYCMVVDFAAQVGCCAGGSGGDAAAAAAAVAASLVLAESAAAPSGGWMEEPSTDASSPSPSATAAVRGKLSDVKAVVSETERLGRKIMSSSGGTMVLVTLVAKITMAVVSTSVLHALTAPPSRLAADSRRCTLGRGTAVPEQLRPWRESLSAINDRLSSLPASVAEHENVAAAVRHMLDGKMEAGGGADHEHHGHVVELLRTRSGELREGVEVFDCVLDQVFDEVIKGRNEMLGIFRDKALT